MFAARDPFGPFGLIGWPITQAWLWHWRFELNGIYNVVAMIGSRVCAVAALQLLSRSVSVASGAAQNDMGARRAQSDRVVCQDKCRNGFSRLPV
jgi:hypothetical protein